MRKSGVHEKIGFCLASALILKDYFLFALVVLDTWLPFAFLVKRWVLDQSHAAAKKVSGDILCDVIVPVCIVAESYYVLCFVIHLLHSCVVTDLFESMQVCVFMGRLASV